MNLDNFFECIIDIDSNNAKIINKYGEIGLYMILAKKELESWNDRPYSEEEIYLHVKKNLEKYYIPRYKDKITVLYDYQKIDDECFKSIESIPDTVYIYITGIFEENIFMKLLKYCSKDNLYFKEIFNFQISHANTEQYLYNARNIKRLKKKWDYEKERSVYYAKNDAEEVTIKIDNTDKVIEIMSTISKAIAFLNAGFVKKIKMSIEITRIEFLRCFNQIIYQIDQEYGFPYDEVSFDLNLDKVADEVSISKRYSVDDIGNLTINYLGIKFENFGSFKYFSDFINVIKEKTLYLSDIEKVVFVTKLITNYLKYDYINYEKLKKGEGNIPDRDVNTLINAGVGVCRDYAALTDHILNKIGIDCQYIGSTNKNPDKFGHAFNLVYIDGIPYYLDNTWIDSNSELYKSKYFLVSSQEFLTTHGEYTEVDEKLCPENYDRYSILMAERRTGNFEDFFSPEDLERLSRLGQGPLASKIDEIQKRGK